MFEIFSKMLIDTNISTPHFRRYNHEKKLFYNDVNWIKIKKFPIKIHDSRISIFVRIIDVTKANGLISSICPKVGQKLSSTVNKITFTLCLFYIWNKRLRLCPPIWKLLSRSFFGLTIYHLKINLKYLTVLNSFVLASIIEELRRFR